ncbi:peptide-methionine (S)-S-oxide reductase [Maribacter sp. R77961]|uniref:peptide-methionine (S)-S-oxide reductase n=1 Tax=Maribacter sp. R77961 TaxID=3093871 RepID=UPI0037C54B46
MSFLRKIAMGGGCHWCTEAVFQSLKGVHKVEQGFVAPLAEETEFSEGVIIHYDATYISLQELIRIHLHTHASTKTHSMRHKYRSAVYVFSEDDIARAKDGIKETQKDFTEKIITQVLNFGAFSVSKEQFQNYYYKNTKKPFCKTHISPKLNMLMKRFSKNINEKILSSQ